jgi:hypothetical protein
MKFVLVIIQKTLWWIKWKSENALSLRKMKLFVCSTFHYKFFKYWRVSSSGIWRRVVHWIAPDVSEERISTCLLAGLLSYSSTLKMEVIRSSEMSGAIQRTTRCHIPEDDTLHNHRCENLNSYSSNIIHRMKMSCASLPKSLFQKQENYYFSLDKMYSVLFQDKLYEYVFLFWKEDVCVLKTYLFYLSEYKVLSVNYNTSCIIWPFG